MPILIIIVLIFLGFFAKLIFLFNFTIQSNIKNYFVFCILILILFFDFYFLIILNKNNFFFNFILQYLTG